MKLQYSDFYIKINGIIVFIGISIMTWGWFPFRRGALSLTLRFRAEQSFLGASDKPIWP